jgi:O-antigen ligase
MFSVIITNKYNVLAFISSLVVPSLILGPFIPDLIISFLSIWFVFYVFKNKKFYIYKNKYLYFFLFFWFFLILSSLLSQNIILSLKTSLLYIRIAIFALLISYLINNNKKILILFYYFLFFSFLALNIDGYFQYFKGSNLLGYVGHPVRISSFFEDELILGSYLVRLLPLFLALFFIKKNKSYLEIILFSITLVLTSLLILFSGERASLAFYLVASIFLIILLNKFLYYRLAIFIVSIFLISFFILKDSDLKNRFIESPIENIGIKNNKKNLFSPEHESLFKTAWNIFLENPILGTGPKTFRLECKNPTYATGVMPCQNHPHNFYIQLLSETGILGFLCLFSLFLYIVFVSIKHLIFKIFKKIYLSNYQISLFAGLLITVWPLTTNGDFFTNNLMIIYSLQIGFFKNKF